jgi:hypothetical protein
MEEFKMANIKRINNQDDIQIGMSFIQRNIEMFYTVIKHFPLQNSWECETEEIIYDEDDEEIDRQIITHTLHWHDIKNSIIN